MKPELTPELKDRFFALYWGQKIMSLSTWTGDSEGHRLDVSISVFAKDNDWFLFLRPLSSISDPEFTQMQAILFGDEFVEEYPSVILSHKELNIDMLLGKEDWVELIRADRFLEAYDFLRDQGFALPFMGHSVETLANAGWIKLSET